MLSNVLSVVQGFSISKLVGSTVERSRLRNEVLITSTTRFPSVGESQETGISAGTFLEKDRTNIHAAEIQHYVLSPLSEEEPETIKQLQTGYMLSDLSNIDKRHASPLELAAHILHALSAILSLAGTIIFCLCPLTLPLMLFYIFWILKSNDGCSGNLWRRSENVRRSRILRAFASYFPCKLRRTTLLSPRRKYIFAYHPHGIICHGAFAAFATEALGFSKLFPGITNALLTLDTNFKVPFYREYILSTGLGGVARSSCRRLLSSGGHDGNGAGRAITIAVGGARESLVAKPGTMRIIIRGRKGFVKLAVEQGADLVPVLGFGENDLYDQVEADHYPSIKRLQSILKQSLGWTLPIFYGRSILGGGRGFLPYQKPVNVVVGEPVNVVRQEEPDPEYVDHVHQAYMDELRRLWDKWKDIYAKDRKGELEFL
ncbi:hypothetical protein DTO166G4_1914 [Paecilomyces variotii]|nr:hypothetical protein DTO166G4_1914 [Paecilomyces variotii]KAJ9228297.1 hypothetical protein DTO166G5_8681 [Paecilomyces variotii]